MACVINASITSTGLVHSADATGVLNLQTDGTNAITVNANANVTINNSLFVSGSSVQPLVLDTAKASTSGTSVDFTGIPSWVKRITLMLNGISLSGTSNFLVQIGNVSYQTSGYTSVSAYAGSGPAVGGFQNTTGMIIVAGTATNMTYGSMVLSKFSDNVWSSSHSLGVIQSSNYFVVTGGGFVTLSGTVIDRIRITTVNGTDTFDAGSVNILYE